ncbi:TERF1-interacting nuclear factor 2 [Nematolebias whitei]|uniref:TERF1-interacting nuclear factor 2 n=1 Tax=Nematolebias whitei TaxID=451745 RepID=UPI001897F7C9|nr:TERF1-interacting nuclear factor 2 [Nematolebias whitei]
MATKKPNENGATLPFAALQLLAPPVRLVSAALWKVMKQRDVMQYGVVEEFVTSACLTLPGLLTFRHQGKLTLGLRARLILELCRSQPDADVIAPHLERIRAPASSSVKKDVKILKTVENFHFFIHTLLANAAERERFFNVSVPPLTNSTDDTGSDIHSLIVCQDQFPVDYGPKFEQELEKLLWEFLIRLDQLLPVPSLAQTLSWLGEDPTVLEECAQFANRSHLLDVLLQHQACLGHLESAASLPPNMGDSILASLSLPPSGRVASNYLTGDSQSCDEWWNSSQPGKKSPFIAPVIGLISNENVPVMISTRERPQQDDEETNVKPDARNNPQFTLIKRMEKAKDDGPKEIQDEGSVLNRSGGIKRKQAGSETEEVRVTTSRKKRLKGHGRCLNESEEDEAESVGADGSNQDLLSKLHLPEDPFLCSVFTSCLSTQPRVVVEKLSLDSSGCSSSSSSGGGKSFYKRRDDHRRKVPERKQTSRRQSPESPGLDNKENQPVFSSSPSSLQRSNAEASALRGDDDEYVADSEDEGTKNFKGRLFVKRYYKTKHGTYVPTLREFWKPGVTRRDALSSRSKRR